MVIAKISQNVPQKMNDDNFFFKERVLELNFGQIEAAYKWPKSSLKELFIYDAFVHYFLWPLIILSILLFFNLPQSLKLILMIFLGTVSIICLPFALYRINNALYLANIGIEIVVKNISVEHALFGTKIKFEYVTFSGSSKLTLIFVCCYVIFNYD